MSQELQNLGFNEQNKKDSSLVSVQESRAVAEVQAAYVIAKKFPRDQFQAFSRIIDTCKRPILAENAMYAYPKGGTTVTGPSIRLAEAIGQHWGNLDCGVREISQASGVSVAEAYAIDLETNTRVTKTFHVEHKRDTKKGSFKLTDARDIYELVANQGARRLRACILAIIPGDIVDAAVEQCKKTLLTSDVPLNKRIKKLVVAFDEIGVKIEHIEERLGHNIDAIIPQELVNLTTVYKSIRDGAGKREDFFNIAQARANDAKAALKDMTKKMKLEVDPETGEVLPDDLQG